ncbi:MAG: hypothetical protein J5592_03250, partial [Clostridia bacterium]|nr:hypothetical protein [Clostridia bacterium]
LLSGRRKNSAAIPPSCSPEGKAAVNEGSPDLMLSRFRPPGREAMRGKRPGHFSSLTALADITVELPDNLVLHIILTHLKLIYNKKC